MLSRTADHLFWTESGRVTLPAQGHSPDEGLPACKPAGVALGMHHAL